MRVSVDRSGGDADRDSVLSGGSVTLFMYFGVVNFGAVDASRLPVTVHTNKQSRV